MPLSTMHDNYPGGPEKIFRQGILFMEEGDYAAAEASFRHTLTLAPNSLETLLNLGYALDMQGKSTEALNCYEQILAASPENAKARYNRASHLLRQGDFANGFADYEARFSAIQSTDKRTYSQPRWNGSELAGRTLLVYCEQGLGDALMFARYLPLLARAGAKITLEVQEPLLRLLQHVDGIDQIVVKSPTPPATDYQIPLLSLPFLFQTKLETIPHQVPYIWPPESVVAHWRSRIDTAAGQYRVGLAWAGKEQPYPYRSCPPQYLAPLFALSGVTFYSLQVGEKDRLPLPREFAHMVVDLTDEINDFADTAALIANLDLVITIDSAVAHLAGAMGKPVWLMLHSPCDWRWMSDRQDSPWYPSMRLFRQQVSGGWPQVVMEVASALGNHHASVINNDNTTDGEQMLENLFQQALSLLDGNYPAGAISIFSGLIEQLPHSPSVWFNLGRAYDMAGQIVAAEQAYRQACSHNADSPAIWFALGELLLRQTKYQEAEYCLHQASQLKRDSIEILLGLGNALAAQGLFNEAMECCHEVLRMQPDCSEAKYNMAFIQLRLGNYLEGFANFESRLEIAKFSADPRVYQQPRWDGSDLTGKTILIYGEQGMGDVIQFARYIPFVAAHGGQIIFEVDPPLIPLFENFPGITRIIPKAKNPPLTDLYIQTLSLPHLFGTTIETVPATVPYIFPDAAQITKWQQILGTRNSRRVGLVWRGNPENPRDKDRSCPLAPFAVLADQANVSFYSLQVGDAATEASSPASGIKLTDFSDLLTDFTETAALIANLDLVIAVDTAVAHLAGAMGQNVWVILPRGSEWRWLEGHADSPWYPTMRLFAHDRDSSWEALLMQVKKAMQGWLKEQTEEYPGVELLYDAGARLKEAGDLAKAESCFRQVIIRAPDLPDPLHSLGVILQMQERAAEAAILYRQALAMDPTFIQARYNLANALLQCGLYLEAIEECHKILSYAPDHAGAHWLLGMLMLQQGDFTAGWQEYEWRWQAQAFQAKLPTINADRWDGSPLSGKRILIQMEQGKGDVIQFIRYVPLVAAMGGRVIVSATAELLPLLSGLDGVIEAVDQTGILPEVDCYVPVLSLPYLLKTTLASIPGNVPYLRPDPEKVRTWQNRLADDQKFKVGLAWQGSPAHRNDRNRSCPPGELMPLLNLPGVTFYSLQFGHDKPDIVQNLPVVDHSGFVHDFTDSAAFIANLDLIISVDTAVAHLAGALGTPVWTLLPFVPEWRWLLERSDSPWYPTMRLFRQVSDGNWPQVIEDVRNSLEKLISEHVSMKQYGIELMKAGQPEAAVQFFKKMSETSPRDPELLCNLGVALAALHKHEDAIICYKQAIELSPQHMPAFFNMGNALLAVADTAGASACFERVIAIRPDFVPAYLALGEAAKQRREFALARWCFKKTLSSEPASIEALQGMAEISQAEEHFPAAIYFYQQALALEPHNMAAWNLLGTVYHSREQLTEAEHCYRKALELLPENPTVLNNLGVILIDQGRVTDAIELYQHLLRIDSSYAEAHWNHAVALLTSGEYLPGWNEYEWRFKKTNPVPARDFPQPRWDGSFMPGKTILLHAEQGFGDTIQFIRYAPLVAERGLEVIVECQVPGLVRLMQSVAGVKQVVVTGESLPDFDVHLPLLSLPSVFDTTLETIPSRTPYVAANRVDIEHWRQRLNKYTGFRVGLVWYAKQTQLLNRKRSCRLQHFIPLCQVSGIDLFSLQIGIGTDQLRDIEEFSVINDLTNLVSDFADTAAFIANLDLVITIDTAVAHLAGALGARTWLILPYAAEWRWLTQREDTPWYPTMRIFRQPKAGDWPSVIARLVDALHDTIPFTGSMAPDGTACTKPAPLPALQQPESSQLQPGPTLLVGLAWAGRQDNLLNCKRTCPFSALRPLLSLNGIKFVSLQLGAVAPSYQESELLVDLTGHIKNFSDTAALISNLDLVITIDTSVAHLAGALGVPTWVLLPHIPDWRWLCHKNDTPWYPSVRIFRQPDFGDWSGVVRDVAAELSGMTGKTYTCPADTPQEEAQPVSAERQILERILADNKALLERNQNDVSANLDAGAALAQLGRHEEAICYFQRVLTLDSGHVAGHLNLAYAQLAVGNFLAGWDNFEWRRKRIDPAQLPPYPFLHRDNFGTHNNGTTLLVHCEQGYGDTIMFARFLPVLHEHGYRTTVSCQPPLADLVASVPGVHKVVGHGQILPQCELQLPLLSLPWLLSYQPGDLRFDFPYFFPGPLSITTWQSLLVQAVSK